MKIKEYFDRLAEDLDALAWDADTAPWAKWAWRIIEEEIGSARDCTIVDLGAGTGRTILNLLRFVSGARFLGVDFSAEMIRRARQKDYGGATVEFQVIRIDRLRLPPQSVDFFTSFGTFHHIKNKQRVLQNLSRMLRLGGKLINADLFKPAERYFSEMKELRRQNPEATAATDRKREEVQWIYDRDRSHPKEFHTDPYEFGELLKEAGICRTRVHASLLPGFALVVGEKTGQGHEATTK